MRMRRTIGRSVVAVAAIGGALLTATGPSASAAVPPPTTTINVAYSVNPVPITTTAVTAHITAAAGAFPAHTGLIIAECNSAGVPDFAHATEGCSAMVPNFSVSTNAAGGIDGVDAPLIYGAVGSPASHSCPPSAAELAAGVVCAVVVAYIPLPPTGKFGSALIPYATSGPTTTTGTTVPGGTTTTSSTLPGVTTTTGVPGTSPHATTTAPGTLPFTGSNGVTWLAILGIAVLCVGVVLLVRSRPERA
jgi:LPXTG-motif cell wall-anchored protein